MLNKNLKREKELNSYHKNKGHIPVLLNEVKSKLNIKKGHTYIDGTYGSGGHTEMILSSADCRVISIDRDPHVKKYAELSKKRHPHNFDLILGRISNLYSLLKSKGIRSVNGGILFDLGVSSMQLNGCDRGFSFQIDGPLDMRMEDKGETAADIIKHCDESTLANIIYMFGEERKARRIARAIIKNREIKNISSTLQLAEIVRSAVGYSKNKKIDPATRTFQALRIKVNNELDEIYKALIAAEKLLTPGARLVIISFHSLEDKIVKSFFKEKSGKYSNPSRHTVLPHEELHYPLPVAAPLNPLNGLRLEDTKNDKASFRVINKKVIKASRNEISQNPRSRSARLRAAERLDNRMEYAA